MKIDINAAIADLARQHGTDEQHLLSAANRALDTTARAIEREWKHEMRDVFSRPTPYTIEGTYVVLTQGRNLKATVGLKQISGKGTAVADYLAPQIVGGERKQKRFERALQAIGALPRGYRVVPGQGAQLDAYGNMSRGQIVQVLSFLQALPEVGYLGNLSDRRRRQLAQGSASQPGIAYFVGRPGDRLPLGVYQRVRFGSGSAIKPIMIFVRSAQYQPILDLAYVTQITFDKLFPVELAKEMAKPPP